MPQEQLRSKKIEQPLISPEVEQVANKEKERVAPVASTETLESVAVAASTNQATTAPISPVAPLTPRQEAIDDILEDGLTDIYLSLSPEKQQELQKVGAQTVRQIDVLLDHVKSQWRKIMSLIRHFLSIIPGINKFFLEQEVKIKTDRIIALKDK